MWLSTCGSSSSPGLSPSALESLALLSAVLLAFLLGFLREVFIIIISGKIIVVIFAVFERFVGEKFFRWTFLPPRRS